MYVLACHAEQTHDAGDLQNYGLAQDCGNSSASALELPQTCAEPRNA